MKDMIDERFTIIGLWIFVLSITFLFLGALALAMSHDGLISYASSFATLVVAFIAILELILCTIYVEFKNNPEQYGYTRIEQEVEAYEE